MGRALSQAARRGDAESVRLLLAHHARTDEKFNGKLPWEHALRLGRLEVARVLEEAGAPTVEMDEVGRFISLCMAGDERGARAVLEQAPDLRTRAPEDLVHGTRVPRKHGIPPRTSGSRTITGAGMVHLRSIVRYARRVVLFTRTRGGPWGWDRAT
jgi:ankyrin repeat protein